MKTSGAAYTFLAIAARFYGAYAAEKSALLMIDVQNCFCEGNVTSTGEDGSLSVEDTASLIPVLNELREEKACLFDSVVRSQDFHPSNHISFGPTHGLDPFSHLAGKGELPLRCVSPASGLMMDASCCPTYHVDPSSIDCETQLCPATTTDAVLEAPACTICQETPEECFDTTQAMWTNHCLQDGDSDFPSMLNTLSTDVIVQKGTGTFVDAYSAFFDNTQRLKSELDNTLQNMDVTTLYVVGIATDYCVYYSALDALKLGYKVVVIEDATRGIAPETVEAALVDMAEKGAAIVNVADIMAMECPAKEVPSPASSSAITVGIGSHNSILVAVGFVLLAACVMM